MTRPIGFVLLAAFCLLPAGRAGADAGDTFLEAQVLPAGATSVDGELLFDGEEPTADLLLGVFDGSGVLLDTNDDDSPLGDGLAPALFAVPVNPGGEIEWNITGASDENFDGSHFEFGGYLAEVTVYDSEGEFLDFLMYDGFLVEESVDAYFESDPSWDGGSYDVIVNNAVPNDLDYFRSVPTEKHRANRASR